MCYLCRRWEGKSFQQRHRQLWHTWWTESYSSLSLSLSLSANPNCFTSTSAFLCICFFHFLFLCLSMAASTIARSGLSASTSAFSASELPRSSSSSSSSSARFAAPVKVYSPKTFSLFLSFVYSFFTISSYFSRDYFVVLRVHAFPSFHC